jgi:cytochrome c peroxidase
MVKMFQEAYGSEPNPADYGKALAVFQRHFIVTGPSPFDRHAGGDASAMEESAVRGMALFKGKANCIACHNGPNFTDSGFYNVGLAHNAILDDEAHQKVLKFDAKRTKNADWESITTDPGRYLITHEATDRGRFKTPTLRNLADTAPYMHDGRYWTLDEVIDHYDRGGDKARNQDQRIKPLGLSDQEKQDLKAFLTALRGRLPDIRMEDWVRPVSAAAGLDGKALFEGKATCVNCHQADGKGVPGVFPPLAGNPRVQEGDGSYVAHTIIHGRSGEISVHGKVFNAVMPPVGTQQGLSDAEIAAVASYVRGAWGNQATTVTEEIVRQQR